jgi:HAMP domain-containing protein
MLGAALLLIGIIVIVYANRLTGKIESLTDVANRMSAGDLEMEIEMKSRDEIGELAQAIARMRDNIRLYI